VTGRGHAGRLAGQEIVPGQYILVPPGTFSGRAYARQVAEGMGEHTVIVPAGWEREFCSQAEIFDNDKQKKPWAAGRYDGKKVSDLPEAKLKYEYF
jgi:hypothetical protein